jgi:hypothetical protein
MSGSGSALANSANFQSATSGFSITFVAQTPASYTLSGSRVGLFYCVNCDDVELSDTTSNTVLFHPAFYQAGTSFSTSGALIMGHQYVLGVGTSSGVPDTQQTWNFNFVATSTAVPVPALGPSGMVLLPVFLGITVALTIIARRSRGAA